MGMLSTSDGLSVGSQAQEGEGEDDGRLHWLCKIQREPKRLWWIKRILKIRYTMRLLDTTPHSPGIFRP